ncbi:hypothetical protein ACFWZ2_41775 [Streptomyces sp. NPDC059002]|uniref:hypothetical protein n=1 Tax=Streptomyces sp. NPDC059002 TaxID=3346690 RepID=UPI0036CB3ABE
MARVTLTVPPWGTSPVQDGADRSTPRAAAGDGIVIHWPLPGTDFGAGEKVFERIAMEAPARLISGTAGA